MPHFNPSLAISLNLSVPLTFVLLFCKTQTQNNLSDFVPPVTGILSTTEKTTVKICAITRVLFTTSA